MADDLRILFGDIHNHNAYGYGVGSMDRSIDIARTHLDFFAFTGHASWHDMVAMEGGRENHWIKGFEKLAEGWPTVQSLIADANRADDFSAFLGYEWHSSQFGDQCVVFPEDNRPLMLPDHIAKLRQFCVAEGALMIPHHLAYPTGRRGVNWQVFDPTCTPVVEIMSEHGNSEHDRGPNDYFNHSMGGRVSANTARHALDSGLRFGFVGSTDSHSGFPGAYGEGLMAAVAPDNSRRAIIEAINARRTYALTGDRIEVDFTVDGELLGGILPSRKTVEAAWDVRGRDEMDVVEVICNGHVVHRDYPGFPSPETMFGEGVQLRLEWGWGPWGDLALERTCDWRFDVTVKGGRLHRAFPCLQSGPFDEQRRHRITPTGENALAITSYTSRRGAYRLNPNQSLVLELDGDAATEVEVKLSQPVEQATTTTLGELAHGSRIEFTGPFPKESYLFHRLVPRRASRVAGRAQIEVPDGRGYVYLRVKQQNGHLAWISPVFIGN